MEAICSSETSVDIQRNFFVCYDFLSKESRKLVTEVDR
jgi:hypothetical protein